MQTLTSLLAAIPALDQGAMAQAQQHIDGLLKPPGSLGRLESLAVQLAGMPGLGGKPQSGKKAIIVMCADHGVWHEGVAISPQIVTAIQAANMTLGKTGVCVLAAQAGAKMHVIDVGIDAELIPGVINMRVTPKTGQVIGAVMVLPEDELLLLTSANKIIRLSVSGISSVGRATQGVMLVRMENDDTVTGFDLVDPNDPNQCESLG